MLRHRNPLAKLLAESRCVLEFPERDALGREALNLEALLGIVAHGGTAENLDRTMRVVLPHAAIDAFGCFHLLAGADFVSGKPAETDSGALGTQCNGYEVLQYWARLPRKSASERTDPRTFTQRLATALLETIELPAATRWALAVALDDVGELRLADRYGNSMMIVPHTSAELGAAAQGDAASWGANLRTAAERILRIAERRGLPGNGLEDAIILSSVGLVDRLAWFPKLSPASFIGAPTPSATSSANIFVWTTRDLQVLTVTLTASHPLYAQREHLRRVWTEVCRG